MKNANNNIRKETARVANTIYNQLKAQTPANVFWAWAAFGPFEPVEFKDMPALKFPVDARLHKGNVIIALNCLDVYEIYLTDENGENVREVNDECYFDQLRDVIDRAIEVGDDWDEYMAFCKVEHDKMLGIAKNVENVILVD